MNVSDAIPATALPPWPPRPYWLRALVAVEPDTRRAPPLAAQTLCLMHYGAAPTSDAETAELRRVQVPLAPLTAGRGGECWESPTPVRSGHAGRFAYAENAYVAFVHLRLDESQMPSIEDAIRDVYAELAALLDARGFPHLLRVWNYLGAINQGEGDAERYRQFCVGRYAALQGRAGFEAALPAASAIGIPADESSDGSGGGFNLIVLAGRRPGVQVENPRQLSAFRYPRVYGARSPSFSRATWLPWADGAELLVSGTASIVGHATAHAGDVIAQLRQTAANLETLRAHAVQTQGAGRSAESLKPQLYTLYLRHPEDLPMLQAEIERLFGNAPCQVLHGDICRRELLVEVEAIYRAGSADPC